MINFSATPAMCAIWPQMMKIKVSNLEMEERQKLESHFDYVNCNKGL